MADAEADVPSGYSDSNARDNLPPRDQWPDLIFTREEFRALTRAYAGMVRTGGREWLENRSLRRDQLHILLAETLLTLIVKVFPAARG